MKKLQNLVLNKAVKMTGNQMKHITGGYEGDGGYSSGTCCYNLNGYGAVCGVPRYAAEMLVSSGQASNWCCDSCNEASWM